MPSGGIVGDNLGQFYGEVVFAIAPSTVQKGLIWAGTNDGKIWYTKDAGAHWNDMTKNVGLPPWGTITSIQPSFFDAGTAYISVDYHLMDNRDPFIYKTTDFGETWTKITGGLPSHHVDLRARGRRGSELQGTAVRGNGQRAVLFARRRRALDQSARRAAALAGFLGGGAEAAARSGGFHLRPRDLHSGRHHAAGADGEGRRVGYFGVSVYAARNHADSGRRARRM